MLCEGPAQARTFSRRLSQLSHHHDPNSLLEVCIVAKLVVLQALMRGELLMIRRKPLILVAIQSTWHSFLSWVYQANKSIHLAFSPTPAILALLERIPAATLETEAVPSAADLLSCAAEAKRFGMHLSALSLFDLYIRKGNIPTCSIISSITSCSRKLSQAPHHNSQGNQAPAISYCIPVMNRLSDLRGTLSYNLTEHRGMHGLVEFSIISFDDSNDTAEWITTNFEGDLTSGLLRFARSSDLDTWHFGKAKNAFKSNALGLVYSSLDADNFVSKHDTMYLLSVIRSYGLFFLLHHFSGRWGDGTSGRVSMPMEIFREEGYDELMLPRQFDEIDLILRTLKKLPSIPFLCHEQSSSIFELTSTAHDFMLSEGLSNKVYYIGRHAECSPPPMNPKAESYISLDKSLSACQSFNKNYFLYKNCSDKATSCRSLNKAIRARRSLVSSTEGDYLCSMLFRREDLDKLSKSNDITLVSVVKENTCLLDRFISHYQKLGVERIILIVDHSSPYVEHQVEGFNNVFIVNAKAGDFGTFKAGWIDAVLKGYVDLESWVLVVEVAQFLQLPHQSDLSDLFLRLDRSDRWYSFALLIEQLPSDPLVLMQADRYTAEELLNLFTFSLDYPLPPVKDYCQAGLVKKAFGDQGDLSWRVDINYHVSGKYSCLRRLPVFRYRSNAFLDQELTSLHSRNGNTLVMPHHWSGVPVLSLYQYSLIGLFQGFHDEANKANTSASRASNSELASMIKDGRSKLIEKLRSLRKHYVDSHRLCAKLYL